ncbi:MAG: PTS fructose transporter subunit IIA [Thiogranum sp.]|nr:PTS fructose transporter subunit IIA [Thiogranum sp.]
MSVGILLVTHGNIGAVLLQSANDILGVCPLPVADLAIPQCCEPDQVLAAARKAARQLDSGDGVLVLTDMYGATPSNIACRLRESHRVRVVAGLNLPMLIRVLNYPDLGLDELAWKAVTGGRDGVLTLEDIDHAG